VSDLSTVQAIIAGDPVRRRLLELVASLGLPDCWIGAGFVRNAVWDALHGRDVSPISTDVDVIWFDPERCSPQQDSTLERILGEHCPTVTWSVKNQARMHIRNGDEPYHSATDAMRFWPETATAVAVRWREGDVCEVAAPLGLEDLLGLRLRPAGQFATSKRHLYRQRIASKHWITTWPLLTVS